MAPFFALFSLLVLFAFITLIIILHLYAREMALGRQALRVAYNVRARALRRAIPPASYQDYAFHLVTHNIMINDNRTGVYLGLGLTILGFYMQNVLVVLVFQHIYRRGSKIRGF